jgi:tetratricopeptide (TPR) repeat protein
MSASFIAISFLVAGALSVAEDRQVFKAQIRPDSPFFACTELEQRSTDYPLRAEPFEVSVAAGERAYAWLERTYFPGYLLLCNADGSFYRGGDGELVFGSSSLTLPRKKSATEYRLVVVAADGEYGRFRLSVRNGEAPARRVRNALILKNARARRQQAQEESGSGSLSAAEAAVDLGTCLYRQERVQEAKPILEEAMQLQRHLLSSEDSQTIATLSYLGRIYGDLGEYEAAVQVQREALQRREAQWGTEDPLLVTLLRDLGLTLDELGHFQESGLLWQRALSIREHDLGAETLGTASILFSYTRSLYRAGQYDQAKLYGRRAVRIYQEQLGSHTLTANINYCVATADLALGHYEAAVKGVVRALAIERAQEEPDQELLSGMEINLGWLHAAQENVEDSLRHYEEALHLVQGSLGETDSRVADIHVYIGKLLTDHNRATEAIPHLRVGLELRKSSRRWESEDTGLCMLHLAHGLEATGELDEAQLSYQSSLTLLEKVVGPDHPNTAHALKGYADFLMRRERFAEARELLDRCLAIRKQHLGPEHPFTASALASLGDAATGLGLTDLAEQYYRRALEIQAEHSRVSSPLAEKALEQVER